MSDEFVETNQRRAKLVRISQWSNAQDAVVATDYAQDYLVRGKASQIQKRIAIAMGRAGKARKGKKK